MKPTSLNKGVISTFTLIFILGVCAWMSYRKYRVFTCYKITMHGLENKVVDLLNEDQATAKQIATNPASVNRDSIDSYIQKKAQLLKEGRELYNDHCITTPKEFASLGVIFSHGEKPEDFYLAYTLNLKAAAISEKYLSGAVVAYDRYLVSKGIKQIFGTQLEYQNNKAGESGSWCILEIDPSQSISELWWKKSNYLNSLIDLYDLPSDVKFKFCKKTLLNVPADLVPHALIERVRLL